MGRDQALFRSATLLSVCNCCSWSHASTRMPFRSAFCSACMRTGSLLGPGLAPFQGPALLVYNDGVFSERDYESISRIGESGKKQQAGKTGRFGCVAGEMGMMHALMHQEPG